MNSEPWCPTFACFDGVKFVYSSITHRGFAELKVNRSDTILFPCETLLSTSKLSRYKKNANKRRTKQKT